MRIALVTPHATPPGSCTTSGSGLHVIPLAQALAELGHEITVYARKDSRGLPSQLTVTQGVRIEHVPAGPQTRLDADELAPHIRSFGDYLARRWHRDPPELAHAYAWPSGLAALAGARDLDIPVVQTFHSLESPGGRYRLPVSREPLARTRLKVCLARSVHAVLARSSQEMRQLAALGVPRPSIRVVPWGVDTGHFGPDGPAQQRDGRPRLLTLWPPDGSPGLDVLVRALAGVPGAELVVAGGPARGQLARNKLYQDITRLAARARVDDRLTFTGGVSWQGLPALLRSADRSRAGRSSQATAPVKVTRSDTCARAASLARLR